MSKQESSMDYNVGELVWNDSFRKWVLAPDADSNAYWNSWLQAHPEKQLIVDAARKAICSLAVKEPSVSDDMVRMEIHHILQEISKKEIYSQHKKSRGMVIYNRYWQVGIAAAILMAVVLSVVLGVWKQQSPAVTYTDLIQSSDEKLTEKVNKTNHFQTVWLPDGSKVTLEKNAKISFSSSFTHSPKRKVYLSGTAFFEVAKDPAKPFLVYTNGLITKVLGTKFWVRSAAADKKVSVEVVSGIVSVYSYINKKANEEASGKKINALILTANQKADYSGEDKTLMAAIVEKPIILSHQSNDFNFQDAAIDSVFRSIKKGYGIDIVYDEKSFANRTFTATLTTESLYEKMDIICKAINARYEIIDGKIVVYNNEIN